MRKNDRINKFMHDALYIEVELFDDDMSEYTPKRKQKKNTTSPKDLDSAITDLNKVLNRLDKR